MAFIKKLGLFFGLKCFLGSFFILNMKPKITLSFFQLQLQGFYCGFQTRHQTISKEKIAMAEIKRRDFLGMALGGVTAVGAVASLIAMKKTWDPLPSVVSAGFTTVDVGGMKEGDFSATEWRGKPVYIIKKSKDEIFNPQRDFKIGSDVFTMGVQICTHLGCIPIFNSSEKYFLCPCHGGKFTLDGVNIAGTPPPRPFDIPPFKVEGTKITFGESGTQYQQMIGKA